MRGKALRYDVKQGLCRVSLTINGGQRRTHQFPPALLRVVAKSVLSSEPLESAVKSTSAEEAARTTQRKEAAAAAQAEAEVAAQAVKRRKQQQQQEAAAERRKEAAVRKREVAAQAAAQAAAQPLEALEGRSAVRLGAATAPVSSTSCARCVTYPPRGPLQEPRSLRAVYLLAFDRQTWLGVGFGVRVWG